MDKNLPVSYAFFYDYSVAIIGIPCSTINPEKKAMQKKRSLKISKKVLIETGAVIAFAILLKVVLLLVNAHIGNATTADTANANVQSGKVTITITHMEYQPSVIVVKAGTTITWINHDSVAHTVTQGQNAAPSSNGFNSGLLPTGKAWSYTFNKTGTYLYTCEVHPSMNARIIVQRA
jgi:plastocyanin